MVFYYPQCGLKRTPFHCCGMSILSVPGIVERERRQRDVYDSRESENGKYDINVALDNYGATGRPHVRKSMSRGCPVSNLRPEP